MSRTPEVFRKMIGGPGDGLSLPYCEAQGFVVGTWGGYRYYYAPSNDDPNVLVLQGCELDQTMGDLLARELSAHLAAQETKHLETA